MYRSAADPLCVGDAFYQGGAFAAEGSALLVVLAFSGGCDLRLDPPLLEQQEVELHRLRGGRLIVGEDDELRDQSGQLVVVVGQVRGRILEVLAQPDRCASAEARKVRLFKPREV